MATLDSRPGSAGADRVLLAGFVDPGRVMGHGERKRTAERLRARMVAVELAVQEGPRVRYATIADVLGVSERSLTRWFPIRESLFAFPPPELAMAMVAVGSSAGSWAEVPSRVRPLFEELDRNAAGRQYVHALVALRNDHRWLEATDWYFAAELRALLERHDERVGRRAVPLVGYFTEALRSAFQAWTPEQSLVIVVDTIEQFLRDVPRPSTQPVEQQSAGPDPIRS